MFKVFEKACDYFSIFLFLLMSMVVTIQIFARFILNVGVPWTEELSRLTFIFLVFIGASIAFREKTMIAIDTLPSKFSGKKRIVIDLFIQSFNLIVILTLLRGSLAMTKTASKTVMSTMEWISNAWLYIPIVISLLLITLYALISIIGLVHALFDKSVPTKKA